MFSTFLTQYNTTYVEQHNLIALKKLYQWTYLQYISSFKIHEVYTWHSKRKPTDSSEPIEKKRPQTHTLFLYDYYYFFFFCPLIYTHVFIVKYFTPTPDLKFCKHFSSIVCVLSAQHTFFLPFLIARLHSNTLRTLKNFIILAQPTSAKKYRNVSSESYIVPRQRRRSFVFYCFQTFILLPSVLYRQTSHITRISNANVISWHLLFGSVDISHLDVLH